MPDYLRPGIHVMVSQHEDGRRTIGDSHEESEVVSPFNRAAVDEAILRYLARFTSLTDLTIEERWQGGYCIPIRTVLHGWILPVGARDAVADGTCELKEDFRRTPIRLTAHSTSCPPATGSATLAAPGLDFGVAPPLPRREAPRGIRQWNPQRGRSWTIALRNSSVPQFSLSTARRHPQRTMTSREFACNGRSYSPPEQPLAVICIDGCADEYLSVSIAKGAMPRTAAMAAHGYRGMVRGALPSFTNVNNTAIVTGVPPCRTGICGNFFLNPETGEEVMMNSPEFRRCGTLLTAAADAGRLVAFITAKEKLRTVLGDGIVERGGIVFSSEKVDEARQETHGVEHAEDLIGRPRPEIYSGDASIYVLEAGAALVEEGRADFLYLSLTDFMQHKFAPEDVESLEFYRALDTRIGRLLDAGCLVAATADHGMNAKNKADGSPNVIYVESLLTARFGSGIRVICPITDPYVVHHGALGSLVMVHLDDSDRRGDIARFLMEQDGITEVYDREMAAKKLELAPDRIGDLCVLSARDVVVGKTPDDHDLSVLEGGLRSHGGRYEEMVPLLVSEPLTESFLRFVRRDPRNFDVFDIACNGTTANLAVPIPARAIQ